LWSPSSLSIEKAISGVEPEKSSVASLITDFTAESRE
jgi:hypothetical protein